MSVEMDVSNKVDSIKAEIDSYTNYCRILDYAAAQALLYVTKAEAAVVNQVELAIAQFPYGVGSAIIAGKLLVKQAAAAARDVIECVEIAEACAAKIATLIEPPEGC